MTAGLYALCSVEMAHEGPGSVTRAKSTFHLSITPCPTELFVTIFSFFLILFKCRKFYLFIKNCHLQNYLIK